MSDNESTIETTENGWNVREEIPEQDALIAKLKMVGYALVGILVIGFGYYFYSGMKETTNEEAMTALARISSYYETGQFQKALNGDPSRSIRGGKAGLAACNEEMKNYEEAASLFEAAAGAKDSPLYERYSLFAALNYEKASSNGSGTAKEKAITILKGLVAKNSGSEYTNEAKMGLARLGWHEN